MSERPAAGKAAGVAAMGWMLDSDAEGSRTGDAQPSTESATSEVRMVVSPCDSTRRKTARPAVAKEVP